MNKNIISIDILRGFAASMVFFYHYGVGKVLAEKTNSKLFSLIDLIGSTYSVPLFFLISGFCIHLSQLKYSHFKGSTELDLVYYYKRRFWRIYPIYLIVLLFSCAVSSLLGKKTSIEDFSIHLLFLQGFSTSYFNSINLVLWTITIEVCFYILYPVWYFLKNKLGLDAALILSIITSILSWFTIQIYFNQTAYPYFYFVLNLWGAWCFGAWLAEKIIFEQKDFLKSATWWIIGSVLLIIYLVFNKYTTFPLMNYSLVISLWAWFIVPFLKLESWFQKINNSSWYFLMLIPVLIGTSSYSLYMLHMPLIYLRNIILEDVFSENLKLILGGVWLILIFILSYISFVLFEKPFLTYRLK